MDQLEKIEYQVVHTTAGRIRISIPRLKHDCEYASQLQQLIESFNFCTSVRFNPTASCIVIHYEASAIAASAVEEHLAICIQQACKTLEPVEPTPAIDDHTTLSSEHNQQATTEEKVAEVVGSTFGGVLGETVGETVGALLLGIEGATIGAEVGACLGESLGEKFGDAVVDVTEVHESEKINSTPLSLEEVILEVEHEAEHLASKLVGLGVGECIGEIVGETVGGILLGPPGMLIGAEIGACLGGELGEEIAESIEHALETQEEHKS